MQMCLRWYGIDDPVTLKKMKQIPNLTGIVTALHEIPAGEVWDKSRLITRKDKIESEGLNFAAIESIPVHEDIKLGLDTRDELIDNYCASVENAGQVGIPVVCYNFMPVFDWTRSDLRMVLPDGSNCLSYSERQIKKIDLTQGTHDLPGWGAAYSSKKLNALLEAYKEINEDKLRENLEYFLKRVIPVAEQHGVKMGIHQDDPPWPIFGLPRIVKNRKDLKILTEMVNSPSNGISLCSGSLGADPKNNVAAIIREFGAKGKIVFAHCRNVKHVSRKSFHEAPHPTNCGSLDMFDIMKAYHEIDFDGPMRPDHGRMIWGETGHPGYGLYDRALGAMYLNGLWEAINRNAENQK
ncbi:MAG: mannonate dehydratase [Sedimentisphaeraceae bacterium JB056]